jgi:hypothetical protein
VGIDDGSICYGGSDVQFDANSGRPEMAACMSSEKVQKLGLSLSAGRHLHCIEALDVRSKSVGLYNLNIL